MADTTDTTDETKYVLENMDKFLADYQLAITGRCLVDVAHVSATWEVLRTRLEGKEPNAQMLHEFYKTIVGQEVARDQEAQADAKLDRLYMLAVRLLAEREIPA